MDVAGTHNATEIIISVRTIHGKVDRSDPVLIILCSTVVQSDPVPRTQKARSGPCVNSLLIIIAHAAHKAWLPPHPVYNRPLYVVVRLLIDRRGHSARVYLRPSTDVTSAFMIVCG